MARKLSTKPNVVAPDSDYPYGRIKDKNVPAGTPGTPVDEEVYGDMHQFFEKLMDEAGINHNGHPEGDYAGYQFFLALQKLFVQVASGTNNLATKVVSIGDWDMDATIEVGVAHGLDFTKIRSVHAMIRNDAGTQIVPLNGSTGETGVAENDGHISIIDSTTVYLVRVSSGKFDTAAFDSTSFNRGWVTITYEV